MKHKKQTSVVGIELTQDRLAAVEARLHGGVCAVERTVETPLSINVLSTGADLAGREIRMRLDAAGIQSRACVLCISAERLLIQNIDMSGISEADVDSYLSLEAERAFAFSPEDLTLAASRYLDRTGKARATLAAISSGHLTPLIEALQKAKLKIISITPSVTSLFDEKAQAASAVLLESAETLQFASAANLGLATVRSLSLPAQLEIGGVESGDPAQYDELRRELRLTLRRLPTELRETLKCVRIFGRQALNPLLKETIAGELAEVGLRHAEAGVTESGEIAEKGPQHALPGLVRAACQALSGQPPMLEFWRPREARWRSSLRRLLARGALVRLGLAAGIVVVLLAGMFAWQIWRLSSLSRRWASVRPDVENLQAIQQGIHDRRPWLNTEPERLDILRALTQAFPESGSVWLRSVEIRETDAVECVGFARSNRDCLGVLESLRATPGVAELQVSQVRGEKPIQFSFQYTWKKEAVE